MRKPLLALAVSAFAIGTTEFVIMGLLPDLARSFAVSIPKAGMLVTAYALSVTFGSPMLALALSRVDRKRALLILMGVFLLGNLACAVAPTYLLLLLARILTALCHGAFFGIGSVVAAEIVPKSERAQAIALMFSGLTLANVLGVPAGTALGQAFGWRSTFFVLVPIGLVAIFGLVRAVPPLPSIHVHIRHEFRAVMQSHVLLVLAMSTLLSASMFCVFTYVAPILETVTHLSPHAVTWILVIFGVGITFGNLAGGRLGDWKQVPVVLGGVMLLIAIHATMYFVEARTVPVVIAVFTWGFVQFAAGAPLQLRIVEQASGAPNLASTLNQGAFNLGNASGAALGGLLLTMGFTYPQLSLGSVAVALAALAAAVIALRLQTHAGPSVAEDLLLPERTELRS